MDRLIYTAMSGAKQVLEKQATNTNNMVNANTTGFREQIDGFRAVPVSGKGLATRVQVEDETVTANYMQGSIRQTGRSLDVAIEGSGWIAVQDADGKEAYTRAGSLKINQNGILQTQNGQIVLGDSGPIIIPFDTALMIGKDGTVSQLPPGSIPATMEMIGRIKLVNPAQDSLVRAEDGLFRSNAAATAPVDQNVTLIGSSLEESNVNLLETMVNMITLGRQFDMQMDMIKKADENAAKASQIMNLS